MLQPSSSPQIGYAIFGGLNHPLGLCVVPFSCFMQPRELHSVKLEKQSEPKPETQTRKRKKEDPIILFSLVINDHDDYDDDDGGGSTSPNSHARRAILDTMSQ